MSLIRPPFPKIGESKDGNVYIGNGVYLSNEIYDSISMNCENNCKGHKTFVKKMALAIFGKQNLLTHSITGTQSNKTKAPTKPRLDPTKLVAIYDIFRHRLKQDDLLTENEIEKHLKQTNLYILEKMFDLIKSEKKLNNSPKTVKTEMVVKNDISTSSNNVSVSVLQLSSISKIGERKDGNVYIGGDIYLPYEVYDAICVKMIGRSKKSGYSIFVKDMAMAVFGKQVLLTHSITGTPCNKTKGSIKPRLEPTKLMAIYDIFRHKLEEDQLTQKEIESYLKNANIYITQRIQDLIKIERKSLPESIQMKKDESISKCLTDLKKTNSLIIQNQQIQLLNSNKRKQTIPSLIDEGNNSSAMKKPKLVLPQSTNGEERDLYEEMNRVQITSTEIQTFKNEIEDNADVLITNECDLSTIQEPASFKNEIIDFQDQKEESIVYNEGDVEDLPIINTSKENRINSRLKNRDEDFQDLEENSIVESKVQLKLENLRLKREIEELKKVNIRFQNNLLSEIKDLKLICKSSTKSSKTSLHNEDHHPRIGERVENKIYIGNGIYLSNEIYNSICFKANRRHANNGHSMFVKEMALAIFGGETLKTHSITGTVSNRTKTPAKPPLDVSKLMAIHDIFRYRLEQDPSLSDNEIEVLLKQTNLYIGQKIQDLIKGPRLRNSK